MEVVGLGHYNDLSMHVRPCRPEDVQDETLVLIDWLRERDATRAVYYAAVWRVETRRAWDRSRADGLPLDIASPVEWFWSEHAYTRLEDARSPTKVEAGMRAARTRALRAARERANMLWSNLDMRELLEKAETAQAVCHQLGGACRGSMRIKNLPTSYARILVLSHQHGLAPDGNHHEPLEGHRR